MAAEEHDQTLGHFALAAFLKLRGNGLMIMDQAFEGDHSDNSVHRRRYLPQD